MAEEISNFHEMVHWQQYAATSIGALLASIRAQQYDWIFEWREMPISAQQQVTSWRESGKRPFPLDEFIRPEHHHLPDEAVPYQNIWWAYNWTFNLFLDGLFADSDWTGLCALFGQGTWTTGKIVGMVLGDIAVMSFAKNERTESRLFALRELYTYRGFGWLERGKTGPKDLFDQGWNTIVRGILGDMTTRDLFEAGAVLHELRYTFALEAESRRWAGRPPSKVKKRWKERVGDPYFKAIRAFAEALEIEDAGVVAVNPPLHLGCLSILDLALNPPVPPFVMLPRYGDSWSPAQLYPPARFAILCSALSGSDVKLPDSLDAVSEFESALCEATGLVATADFQSPWQRRTPVDLIDIEDQCAKDPYFSRRGRVRRPHFGRREHLCRPPAVLEGLSLLDYWIAVHRRFWKLRSEYSGFGICYLDVVRLDENPVANGMQVALQHGAYCFPLLQIGRYLGGKDMRLLPTLGMEVLQSWLLSWSVRDSLLDQVFQGTGALSLRHYPKEIRAEFRTGMGAWLSNVFPHMPLEIAED